MSLFYVAISKWGEWKQQDENERIMQRNRSLAKYRICGFYFVHDLCMITFFSVLSCKLLHCIVPVCLSGVCIWIETNMFLLFSFLKPITFWGDIEFPNFRLRTIHDSLYYSCLTWCWTCHHPGWSPPNLCKQ